MIRLSSAEFKFIDVIRNFFRAIDIRCRRQLSNLRVSMNESFRMRSVCSIERSLSLLQCRVRATMVDVCRREKGERTVAMLQVIPLEEGTAECPGHSSGF